MLDDLARAQKKESFRRGREAFFFVSWPKLEPRPKRIVVTRADQKAGRVPRSPACGRRVTSSSSSSSWSTSWLLSSSWPWRCHLLSGKKCKAGENASQRFFARAGFFFGARPAARGRARSRLGARRARCERET